MKLFQYVPDTNHWATRSLTSKTGKTTILGSHISKAAPPSYSSVEQNSLRVNWEPTYLCNYASKLYAGANFHCSFLAFTLCALTLLQYNACIQTDTPIPSSIRKWLKRPPLSEIRDGARYHQDELAAICASIGDLRAAIKKGELTETEAVISKALEIDGSLEHLLEFASSGYTHEIVTAASGPSDECLDGYYYAYSYLWVAQIWNSYRFVRLLLHETILRQVERDRDKSILGDGDDPIMGQFSQSKALVVRLCTEICASVPYLLGCFPDRPPSSPRRTQRSAGALSLLYPLYGGVCSSWKYIDPRMLRWAIGRLQYIDSAAGIRQAGLMAATVLGN